MITSNLADSKDWIISFCYRNTEETHYGWAGSNILSRLHLIEKQTRDKPSYFDRFFNLIKKYLDQKISRLRIWEILKAEYSMDRTYDSLCKYIQSNFPKHSPS